MKSGFTLIELLVVISIIGLLAAAGLASYRGVTRRTQYATARSDMREIIKLIDIARGESGMLQQVVCLLFPNSYLIHGDIRIRLIQMKEKVVVLRIILTLTDQMELGILQMILS